MPKRTFSERRQLQLIKASAGSGKTHRLTAEYLRLLFASPYHYRHILAVTFTNKATDEMKSRIVEELHQLSAGGESDYRSILMEDFSLSEMQVDRQAKEILESMLHDYSGFSVSTIDRFFQQIMRAFTREMGLNGGYNIEVDEEVFLSEIIDMMIFELDKPENSELAGWLLAFMQDKIQQNKSWSIKKDIQELASQLFNEKYRLFSQSDRERIHDKKYLDAYRLKLIKIVRAFENELKAIGERGVNLMSRSGLHHSDFKGGKNSPFLHFVKWANGEVKEPTATFINLADNPENWTTKNTSAEKKSRIEAAYIEGLNACVREAVHLFENSIFYFSAKTILTYYYTLGILNDIRNRLTKQQRETGTLFLSDVTELLNKIIEDSNTPFIYEKTGTHLFHYMIDEFQDTSAMQWDNFRPLMQESLAGGNFNLVVGDVKQSIYRWRNSDWRLIEEQIVHDFGLENVCTHSLDTNWRSDAKIVYFNNSLFRSSAALLQNDFNRSLEAMPKSDFVQYAQTKIMEVYTHVCQRIPSKKNADQGFVRVTFLNTEDEDDNWRSQALVRLPKEIESLQDQGFALKDIAILVRTNEEAVTVAETLLAYADAHPDSKYRYDIISNEALQLGNARSVKAILALLRYFQNREDRTCQFLAVYEFYRFHRKYSPDKALQAVFINGDIGFPHEISERIEQLSSLPLYEMVEAFFALSDDVLDEKENAYVQAFLDIVLKFSADASSDVNSFLEWWDDKGYKKALFSPDDQDAIRLLTIHKSKGLGFGVVIMPFVDWEVDHNPNHTTIIWCHPDRPPFNELSIVPLRYSSGLQNTIFREDYLQEKLFAYIDNLNLLYVAFTRAKHRMVIFAPKPKNKKKEEIAVKSVADLLWLSVAEKDLFDAGVENNGLTVVLNDYFREDKENGMVEFGNPDQLVSSSDKAIPAAYKAGKWQSVPFSDRLRLRLNSIGYFTDDGNRDYGMLMHEIISCIKTLDDLEKAVEKKYLAGEITAEKKNQLLVSLREWLSIQEVNDWYSGKYQILNETQVLHPAFGFSRPDRVMIGDNEVIVVDYKFGDAEESGYLSQVRHYVHHIREMGYDNVSGYVFYVGLKKVVKV
ncbi:UvrD-helicase domain-containing protein [Anaerorudis cellulosivorans]|uniref:UvrD-helicase domain-containing protein n=1 Tax=Anaerorudis cellulosivorans TaxID=3397862 RepID=UPI002220B40C|nr:UvrD-helicase domain-containing protein [Seramator thermalis]MCW1734382.1 UvrD-helicase domain-containing protein [Seramator thermalis]